MMVDPCAIVRVSSNPLHPSLPLIRSPMQTFPRRSFLRAGLAATAGVGVLPALGPRLRAAGANGDVRVAIAGMGGKGGGHLAQFARLKGVRVVAVCDPDQSRLDRAVEAAVKRGAPAPAAVRDFRKLIEDAAIDAVIVSSPNHWHSLMSIWACQAGKDVYVEKPISHNIWEGRKAVEAARKFNRIVQAGTQYRSSQEFPQFIEVLRQGEIGKMTLGRSIVFGLRESIGKVTGPQPIPSEIDYDLWCGPGPKGALLRQRLHYDWHWFWDYGGGECANNGIHRLDACRWIAGHKGLPRRVLSVGGRFGYDDDGQTPNTHIVYYDYPEIPFLLEIRGLPRKPGMRDMDHYRGIRSGLVAHCENGYFVDGGALFTPEGKKIRNLVGDRGAGHAQNFIDAVRSRRQSDLKADILECHISTNLCHLGNIAHRVGQGTRPAETLERIKAHPAAAEAFERMCEHLRAHNIDLDRTPPTFGAWLELEPDKEAFTGPLARAATPLLRREYRAPYVVPEQV